jgi:uncharacterized repeat protein (TIGR01451 family)
MKWYAGALLLLVIAYAFGLELLAYAMYVLLGLIVVSRYVARQWIEGLQATRTVSQTTAEIGEVIEVSVELENRGALPAPWILYEDLLPRSALVQRPPRLVVLGRRLGVTMLRPRGKTRLVYAVRCEMRGYYQIGPTVLESGDVFGLHRRWRAAAEPAYVLVYPRVAPLANYDLSSRRPIGEIRVRHRLYEDPTRIAGIRAYEPGDPLNRVNWRATARAGSLQSKVFEATTVAGATVVLDFHQAVFTKRHEPVRSELAVSAAASLAHAVYHLGQQIGFVTNGRDAVDRIAREGWAGDYRTRGAVRQATSMVAASDRLRPVVVPTRRGPEQFLRIREALARIELTDGMNLEQLIAETAHQMPRDATAVVVTAGASPETLAALAGLRRQGFAVTAVLVEFDDVEFALAAGRLAGLGVEARQVKDEVTLRNVCSGKLVGV